MSVFNGKYERILSVAVYLTLVVMVIWGAVSVFTEIRPFWVDEWRIIYNLKFKTADEIWGDLAFMQQFPRLYLYLIKQYTSQCNYSYTSLRLIPWLVGTCCIICTWLLSVRLYRKPLHRFLFILMLVSCGTFTQYYTEVKQYTMELLLSVFAIFQTIFLLRQSEKQSHILVWLIFCLVAVVCPFFSYTYPIVIAPAFPVLLLQNILNWKRGKAECVTISRLIYQWVPLFLCTFSITLFYMLDASHLSADNHMQEYWMHLMVRHAADLIYVPVHIFHFMAQPGSGFVFWWLFGVSGSVATIAAVKRLVPVLRNKRPVESDLTDIYALLVVVLVVALNIAGALPLGEPRLNAFAVPAISVLLISFMQQIQTQSQTAAIATGVNYLMIAGLAGNIFTTIQASVTGDKYERRMAIYKATGQAIALAKSRNLPILVTPEVAWPYDKTRNYPFDGEIPGDWVLMTWPEYPASGGTVVYAIPDTASIAHYLQQLPESATAVIAGNGLSYREYATIPY